MTKIGIADRLVDEFKQHYPDEKLSKVFEEGLSEQAIIEINNLLADKYAKSIISR